ncbi:IclR family transcriptional regulator [Alicyclobacillus fastidiosus]|uniref:IclR family transcriptional regulator n=1 Tax=Alicyclobacillus fastidiosus TaxID=392011 RepID=A0ABV5AGH5_9BACL|nr:IclR family transcriptional regulator [Alicyclobacillus fastidiosus]WEH08961.1 IclR family transcriptional regulator [Alicyclobacillus fastidiosus]
MNTEFRKESQGIQSLEQAYVILKAVSEANRPLSMMELSNRCGMTKTKLHKYLVSLTRIGFLSKGRDLKYTLGNEILLLGLIASEQFDIRSQAKLYIDELQAQFNETFALGIWGQSGPFFLLWQESDRAVNIGIKVGSRVSLTHSATGLIFSAFMHYDRVWPMLEQEIERFGLERTLLADRLEHVRSAGYATVDGEHIPGIAAAAAPVFNRSGGLEAALAVVGTHGGLRIDADSGLIQALKSAAHQLSRDLGYLVRA